ncbi:MAG: (Fe-S)-binding protein [Promethearchaeota archaeon]
MENKMNGNKNKGDEYGLARVVQWLHYCGRCNSCKYLYRDYSSACPAFEDNLWESYTSSGKIWLARDLYENKFPLSESIRDKVFTCTLCGNCTVQCQQEVSNHALDIFEALREECIKNGFIMPAHESFKKSIELNGNPYNEASNKRFNGIDERYFKEKANVLFFVGCTTALRNQPLFKDILDILDYLKIDFTLSKEERCCGSPLLTTGQTIDAKNLAQHNINVAKKLGVKKVITACAGCYRTWKLQYPNKFGFKDVINESAKSPLKVKHISEFLAEVLKKKHFVKSKEKVRVTYHDPCHLGRHSNVYEEPRNLIKLIKNVELIEMPRNRENAWCCGAGGGVKSAFKDWAVEVAQKRVLEAISIGKIGEEKNKGKKDNKNTKIDYIITSCPFCERNLEDALNSLLNKEDNDKSQEDYLKNLKIIDIVSFIKKYLKK